MRTVNIRKQLRYSVMNQDAKELRKFYTLKVAIAYAIQEDGIIMCRRMKR